MTSKWAELFTIFFQTFQPKIYSKPLPVFVQPKGLDYANFLSDCLYSEDYLEDNYNYMRENEERSIIRYGCLRKNIDVCERSIVINWLVYAQQVLEISNRNLYKAIRLFDRILTNEKPYPRQYQGIGVVCLWIISKLSETKLVPLSKIFALCDGTYSRQEILNAELKILVDSEHFKVSSIEPYTIIYYYLKTIELGARKILVYGSQFLIELYMLSISFSATKPSILAATILTLVLDQLQFYDYKNKLIEIVAAHLLDKTSFTKEVERKRDIIVSIMLKPTICSEIVTKYSSDDYLEIAQQFATL